MQLSWSEDHRIGNSTMDNQHKNLLSQYEKFERVVTFGKSKKEIRVALENFIEMVEIHFETEENYMDIHGYPDFDAHIHDHDIYRNNLMIIKNKLLGKVNANKIGDIITSQIGDWYNDHLINHDKKLGRYLQEKGIKR